MPAHTRDEEMAMMKSPWSWPQPYLPIKRHLPNHQLEVAFLAMRDWNFERNEPGRPTVYLMNMVTVSLDRIPLKDVPTKVYDSFEAIVDDGWVVD